MKTVKKTFLDENNYINYSATKGTFITKSIGIDSDFVNQYNQIWFFTLTKNNISYIQQKIFNKIININIKLI